MKNLTENIVNTFATITGNAEKIHTYYICSRRKCADICHLDKAKMTKDKKSRHKWLFDPTMAKCSETGISNSVVTDISNMQQLLTFVKNLNIGTGEPETKFLHTADLLSDRIGGNTCRCKINLKG